MSIGPVEAVLGSLWLDTPAALPQNALTAEVPVRRLRADRHILRERSIWIPAIKPVQLCQKRANPPACAGGHQTVREPKPSSPASYQDL